MLWRVGLTCGHRRRPLRRASWQLLPLLLLHVLCTRPNLRCAVLCMLRQKLRRRKPWRHFWHLYGALGRRSHLRGIQLRLLLSSMGKLVVPGRLVSMLLPLMTSPSWYSVPWRMSRRRHSLCVGLHVGGLLARRRLPLRCLLYSLLLKEPDLVVLLLHFLEHLGMLGSSCLCSRQRCLALGQRCLVQLLGAVAICF